MVDAYRSRRPGLVAIAAGLLMVLAGITGPALGSGTSPDCLGGDSDSIVESDHRIESHDGVELHFTLWYNATTSHTPTPAILAGHGWAGNRADHEETAHWLVDAGYVVLAWDARGFGESGGSVGLNGPDEWGDVSVLIDWLAQEDRCPEILLDAEGDPRIGMTGNSYGGAIQLLAAAHDDRIDAIAPNTAWNDLVHSLAPETLVKRGWVDLLYWSGQASSHGLMNTPPHPNTGGMDERLTAWYLEATVTGRLPADAQEPLAKRSPMTHLDEVQAHTLLTQGYNDTLFLPDEAVASYDVLAQRESAETHLLFHPKGHGHSMSNDTQAAYRDIVLQFYDRHLQDPSVDALPAVTYYDPEPGAFRFADTWPPADTQTQERPLGLPDGPETVTLLQTPAPTSHTEWQQFSGEHHEYLGGHIAEHFDLTGATAVTLETGQSDQNVAILGRPEVHFSVTPHVDELTLFVSLVDDRGPGNVIYNQVTPVLIEGQNGERIQLDLPLSSLAYTLPGDALQVRITTSDTAFHGARETGSVDIHLEGARLDLPGPQFATPGHPGW